MSTFNPISLTIEPTDRPDYLAGAVLQGLARPLSRESPWGVTKTLVLGGVTFGLAPLLLMPRKFRDAVALEQQQLWHLAEWMRLRTGRPEAEALRDSTRKLTFRSGLWMISAVLAAAIVLAALPILNLHGIGARQWIDFTYSYRSQRGHASFNSSSMFDRFFITWMVGLSIGYALNWVQVQVHAAEVRDFITRFNTLAISEGLQPVDAPQIGTGFKVRWMIGAIIAVACGALWGIPMMLAGAVHSSYVKSASATTRQQMAHRVRSMLITMRPEMNVPLPVWLRGACGNQLCRASLSKNARYCPRCGMRAAAGPLDRVA